MKTTLKITVSLFFMICLSAAFGQQENNTEMKALRNELVMLRMYYEHFRLPLTIDADVRVTPDAPDFVRKEEAGFTIADPGLLSELKHSLRAEVKRSDDPAAEIVFWGGMQGRDDLPVSNGISMCSTSATAVGEDEQPCTDSLISNPVEMLGGVRLLFVSHLRSGDRRLHFEKRAPLNISLNNNGPDYDPGMELTVALSVDGMELSGAEGEVAMLLLPPVSYASVEVPLGPESVGKTFVLNGTPFKLEAYAPGNVLISYDKADSCVEDWEYACRKEGEYYKASSTQSCTSTPVGSLLYSFDHPEHTFGQWLRVSGLDMSEYSVTRQMMKDDLKKQPSAADAARYHRASGWNLAPKLQEYGAIGARNRVSQCRKWIETGYDLMCESGGALSALYDRYLADDEFDYDGCRIGAEIYNEYLYINLKPDFAQIYRAAGEYFKKEKQLPAEQFADTVQAQTDYCSDFKERYVTLPMTEADIDDLFTPLEKDEEEPQEGRSGKWYQTNLEDPDTIVFYTPLPDEWLFRARYDVASQQLCTEIGHAVDTPPAVPVAAPQQDQAPNDVAVQQLCSEAGHAVAMPAVPVAEPQQDRSASFLANGKTYPMEQLNEMVGRVVRMPEEALAQGIEGDVILTFRISEDDRITGIEVHEMPCEILLQAVMKALNQFEYRHAVEEGQSSDQDYFVWVRFRCQ